MILTIEKFIKMLRDDSLNQYNNNIIIKELNKKIIDAGLTDPDLIANYISNNITSENLEALNEIININTNGYFDSDDISETDSEFSNDNKTELVHLMKNSHLNEISLPNLHNLSNILKPIVENNIPVDNGISKEALIKNIEGDIQKVIERICRIDSNGIYTLNVDNIDAALKKLLEYYGKLYVVSNSIYLMKNLYAHQISSSDLIKLAWALEPIVGNSIPQNAQNITQKDITNIQEAIINAKDTINELSIANLSDILILKTLLETCRTLFPLIFTEKSKKADPEFGSEYNMADLIKSLKYWHEPDNLKKINAAKRKEFDHQIKAIALLINPFIGANTSVALIEVVFIDSLSKIEFKHYSYTTLNSFKNLLDFLNNLVPAIQLTQIDLDRLRLLLNNLNPEQISKADQISLIDLLKSCVQYNEELNKIKPSNPQKFLQAFASILSKKIQLEKINNNQDFVTSLLNVLKFLEEKFPWFTVKKLEHLIMLLQYIQAQPNFLFALPNLAHQLLTILTKIAIINNPLLDLQITINTANEFLNNLLQNIKPQQHNDKPEIVNNINEQPPYVTQFNDLINVLNDFIVIDFDNKGYIIRLPNWEFYYFQTNASPEQVSKALRTKISYVSGFAQNYSPHKIDEFKKLLLSMNFNYKNEEYIGYLKHEGGDTSLDSINDLRVEINNISKVFHNGALFGCNQGDYFAPCSQLSINVDECGQDDTCLKAYNQAGFFYRAYDCDTFLDKKIKYSDQDKSGDKLGCRSNKD